MDGNYENFPNNLSNKDTGIPMNNTALVTLTLWRRVIAVTLSLTNYLLLVTIREHVSKNNFHNIQKSCLIGTTCMVMFVIIKIFKYPLMFYSYKQA